MTAAIDVLREWIALSSSVIANGEGETRITVGKAQGARAALADLDALVQAAERIRSARMPASDPPIVPDEMDLFREALDLVLGEQHD